MTSGEFCTKATIWLAILAYGWGSAALLRLRGFAQAPRWIRAIWTFSCACFLAHVACAFGVYHHWSHVAAYEDTARQTRAMTGWDSGAGLYINYAFAAAWSAEVAWWLLAPASLRRRPAWLVAVWHGFYAFMIFNGTIVFGHGPVRWLGTLIFLSLAVVCWRSRDRNPRVVNPGDQ
jgi:hypothetical protein